MGFIYVVTDDDKTCNSTKVKRWKVGMTAGRDVFDRVKSFKTYSPSVYLCFCYEVSDAKLTEKQLHNHLDSKNLRIEGEWFTSPSIDELLRIIFNYLNRVDETSVQVDNPTTQTSIPQMKLYPFDLENEDPDIVKGGQHRMEYLKRVDFYLTAINPLLRLYYNDKRCTIGITGLVTRGRDVYFPEINYYISTPDGYTRFNNPTMLTEADKVKYNWFNASVLKPYLENIIVWGIYKSIEERGDKGWNVYRNAFGGIASVESVGKLSTEYNNKLLCRNLTPMTECVSSAPKETSCVVKFLKPPKIEEFNTESIDDQIIDNENRLEYLRRVKQCLTRINPRFRLYYDTKRCTVGLFYPGTQPSTFFPEFSTSVPLKNYVEFSEEVVVSERDKYGLFSNFELKPYIQNIVESCVCSWALLGDDPIWHDYRMEFRRFKNIDTVTFNQMLVFRPKSYSNDWIEKSIDQSWDIDLNCPADPGKCYRYVESNVYSNYPYIMYIVPKYRNKDSVVKRTHWQTSNLVNLTKYYPYSAWSLESSKDCPEFRDVCDYFCREGIIKKQDKWVHSSYMFKNGFLHDYVIRFITEKDIFVIDPTRPEFAEMKKQTQLEFTFIKY